MITHIVSDWLFSPCCVEHQDEFIFERVAVAYSRDYNEVGRAQIKLDDTGFPNVTLSVAMETSGRILPNFELIQALIHVLITSKYEKDPIKDSGENVTTSFSPL